MKSSQIPDSPLLTPTQREVLDLEKHGHPPEGEDEQERRWQAISGLRDRLRDITADYTNLLNLLDADDVETIFEDLEGYRQHREREEEAIREAFDREMSDHGGKTAHPETDDVPIRIGGRTSMPDPNFLAEEGASLREGIVSALAFYYLGVGDREEFAALTEQAIERANRIDDRIPKAVDVSIEVDRLGVGGRTRRTELIEAYLDDDLGKSEAMEVLEAEPGLLVETMFDSFRNMSDSDTEGDE